MTTATCETIPCDCRASLALLASDVRGELECVDQVGEPAGLLDALQFGGVRYDVSLSECQSLLRGVAGALSVTPAGQKTRRLQPTCAGELEGFIAVGEGYALPHPDYALLSPVPRPLTLLLFLSESMPVGDIGGTSIDTLFLTLASNRRTSLELLLQIVTVMSDAEFRSLLKGRVPAERLFNAIGSVRHAA